MTKLPSESVGSDNGGAVATGSFGVACLTLQFRYCTPTDKMMFQKNIKNLNSFAECRIVSIN